MNMVQFRSSALTPVMAELMAQRSVTMIDQRRNRGFFVCPAGQMQAEEVNFMAKEGKSLVCLALPASTIADLGLPLMAERHRTNGEWRHAISIEARNGITTGISAAERAHTIRTAVEPGASGGEIVSPGHVFPVCPPANAAPLDDPIGAMLSLVRKAVGLEAAAFCIIMGADGSVASSTEALKFSKALGRQAISLDEALAPTLGAPVEGQETSFGFNCLTTPG
ncbi:3,4-dihydroxy-2-butanone-4-phosphate synthase [Amaricoccus macauensis]|uniref:3,4-dihydroxy-2-butanone-4-phosphate synthase n=1 Tax=Amaricoccus macauensis TaxID=57001 RepID=UPI003C7A4B48